MIKATFFNSAAQNFFDKIDENKVYTFTDGQIKVANKRFSTLDNDYELFFSNSSKISICSDDSKISKQVYNFTKIEDLLEMMTNRRVNVLAVIKNIGDTIQGNSNCRRHLMIADDSNLSI